MCNIWTISGLCDCLESKKKALGRTKGGKVGRMKEFQMKNLIFQEWKPLFISVPIKTFSFNSLWNSWEKKQDIVRKERSKTTSETVKGRIFERFVVKNKTRKEDPVDDSHDEEFFLFVKFWRLLKNQQESQKEETCSERLDSKQDKQEKWMIAKTV